MSADLSDSIKRLAKKGKENGFVLISELDEIVKRIKQIQKTIIKKSEENMNVIMPGFTHLQNAQPILFSHYLVGREARTAPNNLLSRLQPS